MTYGVKVSNKGCWICKHLTWWESGYEEVGDSGYYCVYREVEEFKTFPCNRKLKCQQKNEAKGSDGRYNFKSRERSV